MKSGEKITVVWIPSLGSKTKTLDGTLDDITPTRMIIVKGDKEIIVPLTSIQYAYQSINDQ